jgi:site-specific DNA recombinase
MKTPASPKLLRCAIYTRKSSERGLDQEFNSLDNQREAAEAFIRSQAHEGWRLVRERYDDGGVSGGTLERPALKRLLADVRGGRIDVIVVYKVDRLTRSLTDFVRLVELFDAHQRFRGSSATFCSARATSWRRVEPRLQALPGRLIRALPA